jgi:TrmH family RNA methyltransferase
MRIDSPNNERLKHAIRLSASPHTLKKSGLAVAQGLHLARSLFVQSSFEVHSVWVPESLNQNSEWLSLHTQLGFDSSIVFELPDALYRKVSRLDCDTGPLVFFVPPSLQVIPNLKHDVVVLDRVQDPGNVGTILRTCIATGISQVVVHEQTAWVWGDKVLRAGMGAHRYLKFFGEDALLEGFTGGGLACPVRATTLSDRSVDLFECDLKAEGIWVFGNEGKGVSAQWLSQANEHVKISQSAHIESLNVAMSTVVCLYEQLRQRR